MSERAERVILPRYPESDHMGEGLLQRLIAELLRPMIARWLDERGERALVGADQFVYFVEGDATRRVAPDVYVVFGEDPELAPSSWFLWEMTRPPAFVLEVASQDYAKDYDEAPVAYEAIGVDELVVFDPLARDDGTSRRVRWQVWRKVRGRGFVCVLRSNSDRVESRALRCWLVMVGAGARTRVRLARGPHGDELLLTDAERAAREREEKERERGEKERERAARVALEAELERLKRALGEGR
jgi:Uma2 family endonuclease